MKNTSEKGMVPDVDYSNDQQLFKSMLPDLSLTVIACEVKDWNLELSPWKGVSIDGRILGGGGSGSFWVDGWSDYAKTHALRKKASIAYDTKPLQVFLFFRKKESFAFKDPF